VGYGRCGGGIEETGKDLLMQVLGPTTQEGRLLLGRYNVRCQKGNCVNIAEASRDLVSRCGTGSEHNRDFLTLAMGRVGIEDITIWIG
jgi:hypothetical protein